MSKWDERDDIVYLSKKARQAIKDNDFYTAIEIIDRIMQRAWMPRGPSPLTPPSPRVS